MPVPGGCCAFSLGQLIGGCFCSDLPLRQPLRASRHFGHHHGFPDIPIRFGAISSPPHFGQGPIRRWKSTASRCVVCVFILIWREAVPHLGCWANEGAASGLWRIAESRQSIGQSIRRERFSIGDSSPRQSRPPSIGPHPERRRLRRCRMRGKVPNARNGSARSQGAQQVDAVNRHQALEGFRSRVSWRSQILGVVPIRHEPSSAYRSSVGRDVRAHDARESTGVG